MLSVKLKTLLFLCAGFVVAQGQVGIVTPPPTHHHGLPGIATSSPAAPASPLADATLHLSFNGDNSGADTSWEEPLGNLLLWSEDLTNAAWVAGSSLQKTDANTITRLNSGDTTSYLRQAHVANGLPYTLSATVSNPASVPFVDFTHNNFAGRFAACWFDTASGAVGTTINANYSAPTCSASSLGGGAHRIVISSTLLAGSTYAAMFPSDTDGSVSGTAGDAVDVTQIQLNAGSSAVSYRKTESLQTVWDFSGNLNHGTRGSTAGADTNDFSYVVDATAVAVQGATMGADDNVSGLDALGAAYTIIQCNTNDPECNGVDSDAGTWVNGVANVGGAVCDIRTAGACNGQELTVHMEWGRVLSAAEQLAAYEEIKAALNADVPTGRGLAYP